MTIKSIRGLYQARSSFDAPAAGGGGGGGATILNNSDRTSFAVLSNGFLTLTGSGGQGAVRSNNSHSSGKYFFRVTIGAETAAYIHAIGIAPAAKDLTDLGTLSGYAALYNGDTKLYGVGGLETGGSYTTDDILDVCIDIDNKKWWSRSATTFGGNTSTAAFDWNATVGANPTTNTGGIDISALTAPFFVLGYCNDTGGTAPAQTYDFSAAIGCPSGFSAW